MLITLHPTFTLRVTVQPPDAVLKAISNDSDRDSMHAVTRGDFWDKAFFEGKTGCDAGLAAVRKALQGTDLGAHIRVEFDSYSSSMATNSADDKLAGG